MSSTTPGFCWEANRSANRNIRRRNLTDMLPQMGVQNGTTHPGASSPSHRHKSLMRRIALQSDAVGAIHVLTAITIAQGANMTNTTEQAATAAAAAEPKATKGARTAKRATNVAPKKGKPGKKATSAKKAPKTEKNGESAPMRRSIDISYRLENGSTTEKGR